MRDFTMKNYQMTRAMAWLDLIFSIVFLFITATGFAQFIREGIAAISSEDATGNIVWLDWVSEVVKVIHATIQLCMAVLLVTCTKEGKDDKDMLKRCIIWRNVNIAMIVLYCVLCLLHDQWVRALIVLLVRTVFFIVADRFISELPK